MQIKLNIVFKFKIQYSPNFPGYSLALVFIIEENHLKPVQLEVTWNIPLHLH